FLKGLLVVTLVEKATLVTENLGFEHDDIGDGGWCGAHQNTFSLRTPIRYWPYWFFSIGWASFSSCPASTQPLRKAISSGQATFRPWRFSMVAMNWLASSRLSCVPVSSQ